jgi:hypothetical protein
VTTSKLPKFFIPSLAATFLALLTWSCTKTVVENPFTEVATLDCRNLIIRNVILKDSTIEVTMENTCKNCEEGWAYLGVTMLARNPVPDTLASDCGTCLLAPRNGETQKYILDTKLKKLPDLKTVQFNFGYLCNDVTYLP